MKYLLLPIHLFRFWYLEGAVVLTRSFKNLILLLEEDLAVGLNWRLFFTPLFHDNTIVGRFLSIIFRALRILIGLLAFLLAGLVVLAVAIFWFSLPVLVVLGIGGQISLASFLAGIGLFFIHIFTHPHKKVWQIKDADSDFWQASWISQKNLDCQKLLKDEEVKNLLVYLETKPEDFNGLIVNNPQEIGKQAYLLVRQARLPDGQLNSPYLDSGHFFVATLKCNPQFENQLIKMGLTITDFENTLIYLQQKKNLWRRVFIWDDEFSIHHLKGVNRGWLGVTTPVLDSVSTDWTKVAAKKEIEDFTTSKTVLAELVNVLSEETNRNVILVGPPGSGKSFLIHFLAKMILLGDAPQALATKRLVELDITKLLSGVENEGMLAKKVKEIFDEVSFCGNIILVIEEIHNLGLGEVSSQLNLFSLLQPYLQSDQFQFIATTEAENYSHIIEKNGVLARLFTKIDLPVASTQATLEILEKKAIYFERKSGIKVSFLALKSAVELGAKLIHDRVLPDSAINLLQEAEASVSSGWVNSDTVKAVVGRRVNVPVVEIGNVEKDRLLNLEGLIHQKLIDQDQAVTAVSDSLRRGATSLREENRPIGSFLFVGPTGVGKTELAKILAEVYFGGGDDKSGGAFLRFDMSEYQNSQGIDRLIGNSEQEGQLTEAVKNKPYSLLLLDEFEKADPKILTLFLQVLEDGRLTDAAGKTVDFTNTIIIATSNAASLIIASGLKTGKQLKEINKEVNEALLEIFKPELLNRFDEVVLFKPLSTEDLQKIVKLKLAGLQSQLKDKGYLIKFDDMLVNQLAKEGFDTVLGARPLKRLIQSTIESKLSRMILENHLQKGVEFNGGTNLLT